MKLVYIGGGYRVSDADAGKLARAVGRKLPRRGFLLNVVMPYGEPAMLTRTRTDLSMRYVPITFRPPKRGWVWFVTSSSHDLSRYTKASTPIRRTALTKARRSAAYAAEVEEKHAWEQVSPRHIRRSEEGSRRAADAHLVAADAFEEAGDMLEAMRHKADAERLMQSKDRESRLALAGELGWRRDQRPRARKKRPW